MHPFFRSRLVRRDVLIGTLLTLPVPELAEVCADAGLDWLFLDMEHGILDAVAVRRMIQTVGERCACVVRVPANEPVWFKQALDSGPAGVIVPQVNSPDEAALAVSQSKFPPLGLRSMGLSRGSRYGARVSEYVAQANDATALIVQIEHRTALANLAEILNVPGIDGVLVGPYDLSASLGKPGQINDPEVRTAIEQAATLCNERGMPCGLFVGDTAAARQAQDLGFTLLAVGAEVTLLSRAVLQIRAAL